MAVDTHCLSASNKRGVLVEVGPAALDKAQNSADLVERAAESLAEIAGSVAEINDMNMLIASAVEEQSTVAVEIQNNMNNIRDIADHTADGAQQTAQASEELSRLASQQQALMAQFK